MASDPGVTWLIDGINVIGSVPDGWWRDRAGAKRRLAERLSAWAQEAGEEVAVVFDGAPVPIEGGVVDVAFAPGGPNAADDAIAQRVARDPAPGELRVVTSDRELAERARAAGAQVVSARSFLALLDGAS